MPVVPRAFPNTAKVKVELAEMRQAGEAEMTEKDEMGRLYNELLEQLQTAEEEKEELQARRSECPIVRIFAERLMQVVWLLRFGWVFDASSVCGARERGLKRRHRVNLGGKSSCCVARGTSGESVATRKNFWLL